MIFFSFVHIYSNIRLRCFRNLSLVICVRFIHFYCLINQVYVDVCVCVYVHWMFIVTCSRLLVKVAQACARSSRARVIRAIEIDQIDRAITYTNVHHSNWQREKFWMSFSAINIIHPWTRLHDIIKLFYAFNCVRKPWRARMSKYIRWCPSHYDPKFFFSQVDCCETNQGQYEKKKLKVRKRRIFMVIHWDGYKYTAFLSIRFTFSWSSSPI